MIAVKTQPGADCGSDHELLTATVRARFKAMKSSTTSKRLDMSKIPSEYAVEVSKRFEALELDERPPNEMWEEISTCVNEEAKLRIPTCKRQKTSPWLSSQAVTIAKKEGSKDKTR